MTDNQPGRTGIGDPWGALWEAIGADGREHPLGAPLLGEYAAALLQEGARAAGRRFPAVVGHLATDCGLCAVDLEELLALAGEELRRDERGRKFRLGYGRGAGGEPPP